MSNLLEFIKSNPLKKVSDITKKIDEGWPKISLFQPLTELNQTSLFDFLETHHKVRNFDLDKLLQANALNLSERNADGETLLQIFIKNDQKSKVILLLRHKVGLSEADLAFAQEGSQVEKLFSYKPGRGQQTIFEFCLRQRRVGEYSARLNAVLLDEADTTDGSSSEADEFDTEELNDAEKKNLQAFRRRHIERFNRNNEAESKNHLCLLAARGVHFSPKYFSKTARAKVKAEKNQQHTTYSQSLLFDAGYDADSEVSENDVQIRIQQNKINRFIERLKNSPDKAEKKIGNKPAPVSRNKYAFDSLYYRFMQVYINSYSRLFNLKSIQIDFGYDSNNNPMSSASWNIEKGGMYSSGHRFDWNARGIRRSPHYRRSTGKPKHPNMGYIDLYALDIAYVREHGFDRQIMCTQGFIGLNSMYRFESEIIFPGMISKESHLMRCILSLPDLSKPYVENKTYFKRYGINSRVMFSKLKQGLFSSTKSLKEDNVLKEVIGEITEKASTGQAKLIETTAQYRLFKADVARVAVHDNGNSVQENLYKI